ncbi:MAG: disulfide bond formation protein B [Cohaesibacter sp.]|nr:disulfide bond formation protein B [Cohaesibacter sp.]
MVLTQTTGTTQKLAALLLLLGALGLLAGAFAFQYIGGYVPCKLCLAQRQPHYAMVLASFMLLLALWQNWFPLLIRLGFIALAAVILYGAGIGVYQAGAEWDFWLGPNDCGGGMAITQSASDLLAQINKTKIVSCNTASWRMFGLSFAGWNVLASSSFATIALLAAFASQDRAMPYLEKLGIKKF